MNELQPVNPPGMADVIPDAYPDVDHFGGWTTIRIFFCPPPFQPSQCWEYIVGVMLLCSMLEINDVVLYCIVLYCIVLYCIVLYCIVLYCIVLYVGDDGLSIPNNMNTFST